MLPLRAAAIHDDVEVFHSVLLNTALGNDVLDLRVRYVAAGICTVALCSVGHSGAASEKAFRTRASGLCHLEGTSIACDADDGLVRSIACLGDHGQRIYRLSEIDVTTVGTHPDLGIFWLYPNLC